MVERHLSWDEEEGIFKKNVILSGYQLGNLCIESDNNLNKENKYEKN